ncbi:MULTISPECIES: type I polyketide synthase [Rhodococcus]|uniref:Polyketide synthase n=1 Tax=Rhodococcus opacus RKJ300 = JCM 13270 TaxID=1165867 RepID=I0WBI4_RHOOP|nr:MULTISPECIES: type I polyketide synthase [Rhodococcus]EID73750.1 polyketide synthase [Rhodococcus opacus RKJ300 = JCM 13270]QQZ17115.1 aminotransferase class I/II-fold pyridoxal phosphate-dependent enzyme [Rhodococcus sp. 21391]
MTDVAVVGLDCRFPQAPDADALWTLLMGGGDGITGVPAGRWNADDVYDAAGGPGSVNNRSGGFLADADAFDHEFFGIAPCEAAAMDPQQRLLLQAAWRAFEDACLDPRAQAGSNTGVYVGVMANEWNLQMRDASRITPQLGSGNGYFMTANRVSYHLNLQGPSMAIDTACSSSLVAVHLACAALRSGDCDQALAGGVNLTLTPTVNVFYTQAGLSAPDGRCKPFSGTADGIGRGEGVAVLVLRRLEDAQAEGLPVYAVIKGSAVNNDGRSNGITAPNRWAQQQVVQTAYRRAGVTPAQVAFVEAHGTGTVLGDMIESKALGHVHGVTRPQPCAIGSIKGNLGHTEGAAGVAGLIKVALSLHHRVVPPSRHAEDANPRLRLADNGLRLLSEPMTLPGGDVHGAVSSFGLGGTNAHMLLASAPAPDPAAASAGGGVLTLSSNNPDGLARNAAVLADDLARPGVDLGRVCWTTNTVKASGRHRLALTAHDREDAVAALRAVADGEDLLASLSGAARPVSIGWFFTGQGAQYPGMSRALHEHHGGYRRALSDVDERMTPHLGRSVREMLFDAGDEIHRTEFAQPALFAVEYALARTLGELGVEPAWLIGHSVGEYAAAAHAGVFALDDACRLIVARGRFMQQLPAGGTMLAVRATPDEVADLLAGEPAAALAAVNGPRDVVLSGAADALERLGAALTATGFLVRRLTVSHAFHSPAVAPMQDAFAEVAADCSYGPPAIPIFSTTRGRLLDVDEPMDAAYWTDHITATVRFADAAAAALTCDPTHLIEVGPARILLPLTARAHPESPARHLAPCPGPAATGTELPDTLAALYRDGLGPAWDALYEPGSRVRLRLSGYDFATTARFWTPEDAPAAAVQATGTASTTVTREPEDTTMDQLIALFREQAAVLAAAANGVPAVALPAPATPDVGAGPATAVGDVATRIRTEVARVSGFPAAALKTTQTIVGDLGFDSIMITDLFAGVSRAFPGLVVEPHWFSPSRTLGDVIEHVTAHHAPGSRRTVTAVPEPEQTVAPEFRIAEFPEVQALAARLNTAEGLGVTNPYFLVNDGVTRDTSTIGGAEVVNFSSYNYLGMSGHPAVVSAVQDAVARYGSSCSASRLLSGEKPVHQELEAELAGLLGTEDAIALVSGHATNVTVIGHLLGEGDLVIHDSLAHDSILQGCALSGATRRPFPHNDHAALDALLTAIRSQYRRVLIVIEGVYSQDGDIPDLPAMIAVKKKHRALMMIDEAHSIGVLGATGGGIGEHFDVDRDDVELWSGTMSKALAGCGGYVAGNAELIRFLKYTTPGFVYSVGITPMNAAASLAAIRQMRAEPEALDRLRRNSRLFLQLATDAGIDTGDTEDTPVIPCIVGDSLRTLALSNALLRRAINVNPILYPAVPEDLARLRFFVTSCHTEDQIRSTVAALAEELATLVAAA